MSTNQDFQLYIFTDAQFREHNLSLARAVSDATAKHTARKMAKMNSAQQLQSLSNHSKSFRLSDSVLGRIVDLVLEEEAKG
jgi:hypothetical protein